VSPFKSGTKPMLWCHTSAISYDNTIIFHQQIGALRIMWEVLSAIKYHFVQFLSLHICGTSS